MASPLLRAGLWITIGVALGRVAGQVRESFLGAHLALGGEADVARFLLTLPDSVINVLMGGAMAGILVPRLAAVDRITGERLVAQVALVAVVLGTFLAVALMGPWTSDLLAPGLDPALVQRWLPVVLLALPMSALGAVFGAALQAQQRFAASSLGTLVLNAGVIIALFIAPGLLPLALGVLAGSFLRLALVAGDWAGRRPVWSPAGSWLPDRDLGIGYLHLALAGSVIYVVPLIGGALATQLGTGTYAAYGYALKLFELPLGVLLTVFATVLFNRLAQQRAAGDSKALATREAGFQAVAVVGVACALVLGVFAPEVTKILFGYGKMNDPALLARVAEPARILALALPLAGLASLLQAWASAGKDTRSSLVAGVGGLGAFVGIALLLRGMGITGLVWATVALHIAMAGVLWWRTDRPALGGMIRAGLLAAAGALPGLALSVVVEGSILRILAAALAGLGAVACGVLTCPAIRSLR